MCLPVALYREGTPMSTGTGEQASLQHPQDYCLHFLPMSRGETVAQGEQIALASARLLSQQTHKEGEKRLFQMEAF